MRHSTSACRPARARSVRNAREYLAAPCCASSAVSWTLVVCPHVRDERGSVDVGNSVRDRCSGKAERAGRVRARIVSPCPGPQRSLALAAAAARRNSSESTPEKSALPRESQGTGCKRPERDLVRGCQVAPAAQARRPLRERLPPSMRRSNEPAALQGYGFTRLRSPV